MSFQGERDPRKAFNLAWKFITLKKAVFLLRIFEVGDIVYIKNPDEEEYLMFAETIRSFIKELKSDGPFTVIEVFETLNSTLAQQEIRFGPLNSNEPFRDTKTGQIIRASAYVFDVKPMN